MTTAFRFSIFLYFSALSFQAFFEGFYGLIFLGPVAYCDAGAEAD
jgi:hypothetical protein